MAFVRVARSGGVWDAEGATALRLEDRAGEHGSFAHWQWDAGSARLEVTTDALGFRPLFWWADDEAVVVATDLLECAAHVGDARPDWDAIAVFLRCGYLIGDTTPLHGVSAVPPGGLVWEQGRVTMRGGPAPVAQATLDRDAAIDAYAELFRTALRRRLPRPGEPYVLPLSGGRDSRHILLELVAAGCPPVQIVTVGRHRHDDPDVTIARRLAARVGVEHVALDPVVATLARERRKNARTNLGSDEGAWYTPVVEHLTRSTALTYDGIGGDVLSAGLFLDRELLELFDGHRFDELADRLLRYREPLLRSALPEETLRRADRDRARHAMSAEVRRHVDAPNPVGSFYFWNRTRREIAQGTYGWLRDVDVQAPYLDHDLVAFLRSLPAAMLLPKTLHSDTIARAHPAFADIGYGESVTPRTSTADRVRQSVPTRLAALSGAARMPRQRRTLLPHLLGRRAAVGVPFSLACWLEQVGELLRAGGRVGRAGAGA